MVAASRLSQVTSTAPSALARTT